MCLFISLYKICLFLQKKVKSMLFLVALVYKIKLFVPILNYNLHLIHDLFSSRKGHCASTVHYEEWLTSVLQLRFLSFACLSNSLGSIYSTLQCNAIMCRCSTLYKMLLRIHILTSDSCCALFVGVGKMYRIAERLFNLYK